MKVLVVQDSLRPVGGSEIVALQTLKGLSEAGFTPVAVCRERDPSLLRDIPVYEVPTLFRGPGTPDFSALQEIMDREKPDIVHVHKTPAPAIIRFTSERLPTVVTVHDHAAYCPGGSKVFWRTGAVCTRPLGIPCLIHAYTHRCAARRPAQLSRQFLFSTQLMKALQEVHRVVTLSGYVREQLIRSGLSQERVSVVPPWIDIPSRATMPGEKVVLFVGRLTREKGLPTLLKALALLQASFKAVVVGEGALRRGCERLATDLGLGQSVSFRGWLTSEALNEVYAQCAFLVIPSLWPEPFGLVGVEAMAHGKPVVAFDVGGISDWLTDGVDGILLGRGDTDALAAAISRLLTDPELRGRLGEAARSHVTERFSRGFGVSRLIATYDEVLSQTGSSGHRE